MTKGRAAAVCDARRDIGRLGEAVRRRLCGRTAGNEGVERQQQLLIGGRDPELARIALDQRGGGDRLIPADRTQPQRAVGIGPGDEDVLEEHDRVADARPTARRGGADGRRARVRERDSRRVVGREPVLLEDLVAGEQFCHVTEVL